MGAETANLPCLVVNTGVRRAAAVVVKSGQRLQVIDLFGRQTATMIAVNLADHGEMLSPAMTRARLNSLMLQLNDRLYSNLGRPMFQLEEDTVGRHDLLLPAYDINYYADVHSAPGHDNCRANLFLAVREFGLDYSHLPDPVTLFGNVSIRQRGELEIRAPLSEAGDLVTLRALMDVIVAVSASPQDHNAQNNYAPTELLLRVLGTQDAASG